MIAKGINTENRCSWTSRNCCTM